MNKRTKENRGLTRCVALITLIAIMLIMCTGLAFAANDGPDVGKNLGDWLQEQVFYIALAVVAVIAVTFIVKRAWIPLAIFIVIAALVLVLIQNPERLVTLGESLWGIID